MTESEMTYPGVALPAQRYVAPRIRRPGIPRVLSGLILVIAVVAALSASVTLAVTKPADYYLCPPQCGRPPHGPPVTALPRFTSQDGSFAVSYPAPGSAYSITTSANGVTARFTGGDGGVMQLFGEAAAGRSPRDIVQAVIRRAYPSATLNYVIPNAMVGYQHGYGEVADDWPQTTTGVFRRVRILAIAAVKNDVALIAFGVGPERAFRPGFGPGPPSGANMQLALDMGKYVNSFRWSGDPER